MYANWGDEPAWRQLSLTFHDSTPLYIGKAKRTLRGREINIHFDAGSGTASKTGSSTVRRSFAALLAATLDLRGVPRNTQRPSQFAH
ncbi:GIY-YIG nuclease family protein [Curtobacterium caseinilyticum]|uniref:GIY-YIG nuclease family protein n=1 Tax=Curtobacterium caseinilyticum TaxID=3055137 RepID=UPI0033409192